MDIRGNVDLRRSWPHQTLPTNLFMDPTDRLRHRPSNRFRPFFAIPNSPFAIPPISRSGGMPSGTTSSRMGAKDSSPGRPQGALGYERVKRPSPRRGATERNHKRNRLPVALPRPRSSEPEAQARDQA